MDSYYPNMSLTVRLSIDDEMQQQIALVQQAYPGLKPSQIIRFGFFNFAKNDPNVQKSFEKMSSSEFTGMIKEFKDNSPIPTMNDEQYQIWWMKNKKELRSK